jgi:ElaA protein
VLVDESHRGRGLADRLVRVALGKVGDRPCRLDAQSYLVEWYRGLGFEPTGPEFLDDGIPHVPMRLSP